MHYLIQDFDSSYSTRAMVMLRAKPSGLLLQVYLRGVKRKRCSGRDASCENRICTVKCEIGTLSASRRVHNFNNFRAGCFRRNAASRSKVDASRNSRNSKPRFEWSAALEWNRWRGVLLLSEAMTGCCSRNDLCCRRLFMLKGISSLTFTSSYCLKWS